MLSGYLSLCIVLSCCALAVAGSVKRNNESYANGLDRENTFEDEKMISSEYWWESTKNPKRVKLIEEEIMDELNHLDAKRQHRIYDELKKQKAKSLVEMDHLSPLNVVELKAIRKSIKTPNSALPPIRNKRTLNFLLFALARAMGYNLVSRNPDAELLPLQSNPCKGTSPRPPPCAPPPHHTTTPPPPPPPPTIPPNQIDANTIRYPYRPSQQIPLLRFAPLPPGVTVPYPPLLQRPCGTPPPPPNPCAPPKKPTPPCGPPPPKLPPCPPPSPPPSPPPCPHLPPPAPPSTHRPPPPCPELPTPTPKPPPPPPKQPKQTHLLLEYDQPVRIQIFNNAKKFLPASGTVYSGDPSYLNNTRGKLEQYEQLDERGESEDYTELTGSNIFRKDEGENYEDGQDEIGDELFGSSRDPENEEPEVQSMRKERFYKRRVVFEPDQKRNKSSYSLTDEAVEERGYLKTYGGEVPSQPKKAVLKRVIVRKPMAKRIDENGNEYSFETSAVRQIRKRDLQDFDFIRKYKETQGDLPEDEHYKENENPPGRTTTSIRKIEVKKFVVNKSEDDPVEYHEKNERNSEDKPEKVVEPEPQQENEGGSEDERINYKQYEPPEYEERREMENELARELENEEEELPKTVFDYPPPSSRGVKYVTKTVTKYVGRGGGRETVKILPIYKVIHAPPPPPRKIVHHHHHRIPVYPRIVVKTSGALNRRPPVIAHFGNAGNILLVTIRERSG